MIGRMIVSTTTRILDKGVGERDWHRQQDGGSSDLLGNMERIDAFGLGFMKN